MINIALVMMIIIERSEIAFIIIPSVNIQKYVNNIRTIYWGKK